VAQTLGVNSSDDIYLDSSGNLVVVSGLDAVLQTCEQVAKTLLGECVLNTTLGVPYFETVWNGSPNVQQFTAGLRTAILSVPDVVEIVSLITSQNGDVLSYTAVIRTVYGSGAISG
jgi:hypothetical protein